MNKKEFYTIYDIGASEFRMPGKEPSLAVFLVKFMGIFVLMTLITFSVLNYHYILSQLLDWRKAEVGGKAFSVDTDGDSAPDWWEAENGLDPNSAADGQKDYDNDGVVNFMEYRSGSDPVGDETAGTEAPFCGNTQNDLSDDFDGDGMPDCWELANGLDRRNPNDAHFDFDADGLNNLREYELGGDPCNPDSDGDGILDAKERVRGTN